MKRSNTFLITLLTFLTSMFIFTNTLNAQLVGIKTIPGDYATIQLAVTELNTQGVGLGGVTFNVAAGYTESITAPITITAAGITGNVIIFQKSGAGANPLITRTDAGTLATSTLGAQGDAVIIIQGSDYLTFDGIDLATSDQGIEYGYYLRKGSDVNGCKFVTIKNTTVTLTKGTSVYVAGIYSSNNDSTSLVSSATGITVTSVDGRNENVTLTGNTISNVFAGIVLRGFNHTTAPYDFYDQNFVVGINGAGNTIQNYAGNAIASAYGVYLIYHNNANVSYNTLNNILGGGSGATSIIYGIFNSTGVLSAFSANNNNINLTTSATTSAVYGINNAATGNLTVDNNIITINTTIANTGVVGFIYNTSAAASLTVSISNNTFVGTTLSTTGSTYLIYNNSSQLTPGVTNVTGNTVSGVINRTGATGTTYCYYNNGSPTGIENIFNNVFDSVNTTGTGALYGILSTTGSSHTHNIFNNTIRNFTGGTGTVYGIHRTLASGSIYENSVYNLAGGGTIYGLSNGTGTNNIYRNNINNLSTSSTATTAGLVSGIYISGVTNHYVYNNFISDLKAPLAASTDAIRGINCTATTASSNLGLYYNTIYLNATSSGANFGTSGIYHTNSTTSTTAQLDMRDNIVVNNSTPVGTGLTVAFRRSAANASLNNYSTLSNNNDFYAGTPGPSNLIFNDGTNSDQTLADFKTRVTPRESASFSENPTFINSTTTPYDLRINTTTPTQIESGGITVATPIAITSDYDGDLRNATTPDVGADEFAGVGLDLTPPVISYNALLNTGSTSARTLSANISDPAGVPTSGIGLPVLYWAVNSGPFTANQGTYVSGNEFSFTFGAGVVIGDTVKYYITAQDNSTTPNVGVFPSAGANGFTPNPPAVTTPPSLPSSYLVTSLALAGDYTVGVALFNKITGKNISFERQAHVIQKKVWIAKPESGDKTIVPNPILYGDSNSGEYKMVSVEEITWIPLENGSPYSGSLYAKKIDDPNLDLPDGIEGVYATLTVALADLNLRGVSADVNFLLTDTLYSAGESFPLIANIINENLPSSTKKITIKPSTGVTSKISGSSTSGIFVSYGVDYVNLEGSNSGGTDRSLTFENTNSVTNTYVIGMFNNGIKGAQNNSIKNCIVKAGGTANNTWSIILNALGGGFNNTTIQNNLLLNSRVAMQFVGVSGGLTTGGSITQNIFGSDIDLESVGNLGVITQYVDSLLISGNIFKNFKVGNNPTGISLSTGSINTTISNNMISGMIYTGTGGYGGKGIAINTGSLSSNLTIANNVISNLTGDGWNTFATDAIVGIRVTGTTGGIKLYYNSVNLFGNADRSATATLSAALYLIGTTGGLDIRNNVFSNSLINNLNTGSKAYAIYNAGTNASFTTINNNDYYASGVQGVLGFQTADVLTIEDWRIATGQDANSINEVALFTDSTNLHIPNGTITALESAGTPIAGITTDIDGQTRNASTPDIGADEFNGINPSNALAGTYYIGVAGSGPGGTDPHFASLKSACDTLNSSNVSANTTFFITSNLIEPVNASIGIDPGDYTVTFKPYTGTVDTITFTQVADNVGVSGGWVFGTPTLTITSATNYGLVTTENIIIDGSNSVDGTTRDLVIQTATGINGNTNPIRIIGDVNNCTIKNSIVKTNQSVSYAISITNRNFSSVNWTPDNIVIDNCSVTNTFGNAAQGIAISNSGTPTAFPTGVVFKNNDVLARTRGIFLNYAGNTDVFNNRVSVNQTQTGSLSYGIWGLTIGDTTNVTNIYNNQIILLSTANATVGEFGIVGIEAGSKGTYNIYNNMISGFTTTTVTANPNVKLIGIRLQGALVKSNVYHNSIYLPDLSLVPGTGTVLYAGFYIANGTNDVKNNIVHSDEVDFPSYCIYRSGILGTLVSDFNDFYVADTTNGNIGYWNTAPTKTLANWQTASGLDVNSLSVVAPFTSASDLHIPDGTITSLESAGTPIALVTTDIDGQLRNASTPDIGADEFAGLLQINGPSNLTAVADTFAVLLNWTDNSTNELGFYIERKEGDSLSVNPFAVIDTVGTDVVSYNDLGRTPNTTYTYRVQAYNLLGVSPYSNVITATTIIPVELTSFAANVSDKEISVMWSTATELNNRGFELERKLDAEWQKLTFIEGRGTTTEKSEYSYSDKFKYEGFQGSVQYRLKQIDFDGSITYSNVITVEVDFTPKEYTLYQNYPNPFNPSTTIKFALPFDSNVRITIYNMLGEQIEVIFDQVKEVGYHNVSWNASSLASGVYIYTIDAKSIDGLKNFNSVKKMMLVK